MRRSSPQTTYGKSRRRQSRVNAFIPKGDKKTLETAEGTRTDEVFTSAAEENVSKVAAATAAAVSVPFFLRSVYPTPTPAGRNGTEAVQFHLFLYFDRLPDEK